MSEDSIKSLKQYYVISFILFLISTLAVIAIASNTEEITTAAVVIGSIAVILFVGISLRLIKKLKGRVK